jgi:hypothetical protein
MTKRMPPPVSRTRTDVEPETPSLFERIGAEKVKRLVAGFYARVDKDPAIRPLFGKMLTCAMRGLATLAVPLDPVEASVVGPTCQRGPALVEFTVLLYDVAGDRHKAPGLASEAQVVLAIRAIGQFDRLCLQGEAPRLAHDHVRMVLLRDGEGRPASLRMPRRASRVPPWAFRASWQAGWVSWSFCEP